MTDRRSRWPLAATLLVTAVLMGGAPARAATRNVSTLGSDTGDCTVLPCATIQYAIGQAAPGDTVSVAAGTYVENVTVTKSVIVMGAGQGSTIVEPALSNPNCNAGGAGSLCSGGGAASNIFLVQADDVTIQALTCEGDNPGLTSGVVAGGADLDARNGIITNHAVGTFNNLVVHDVTVKDVYLRGMYASSGGSFDFHDNTVDNVQADPASVAMFNFGGSGSMVHNTVSRANDAISANHSSGTTFMNNTVTTSLSGVHTDNAGDGGGSADLIDANHVSTCGTDGYGVWVFVPYIAPTFSNNVVSGCAVGMAAFGGGLPVTTSFTGNQLDGTGGVASVSPTVGIFATTDQLGFGTADDSTSFTSNSIKNFGEGFHLEQPGSALTLAASGNTVSGQTGAGVNALDGTGTFTCNLITGNGTGIRSATAATVAHMNSIVGNGTGADGTAIPSGNMNATNNWWGCAAGPGNAGCDTITAGVDASSPATTPDPCAPATTTTTTTTTTSTTTTTTSTTTTTTSTTTTVTASTTTTTTPTTTLPATTTTFTLPVGTTTTTLPSCAATPQSGCQPAASHKASLSLQSGRLRWKWRSSATVAQSDFGDPTTSTSYQVCLYDASGLKLSARAPADGTCGNGGQPCWRTLSTTGYRFKDSTGTPNGLTKILLKAGGPGRGKISLRGQGANLQTTATPFTTPVRMQYLRNGSSLCWDATYTTSIRNDTSGFKGKSD